jgi:hypothetical protein
MLDNLKDLRVFDCITFLQTTHQYLINNQPSAPISVTGLLGRYKKKFEADKWAKIKAEKIGTSPEAMKESWRLNNLYATHRGTILHNYIENYYNNKIVPYNKEEVERDLGSDEHNRLRDEIQLLVKQFKDFYADTPDIIPLKKEFVVGDITDTKICGMIDMLAYNIKNNTFEIYDYKTNREIKYTSKFNKCLLSPLEHLSECEFNSYSLQLNIYKYFIEKHTSLKIDKLNIVWFNVKNEKYQLITLADMTEEVKLILNDYSANKSD